MSAIKTFFNMTKIFMKNQIQDKTYVLHDFFNMFSRCIIVFMLYGYVYKVNNGSINGSDYTTVMWSMFIYFCVMTFNIRKIYKLIMDDVKSGNVEMFLNKPFDYIAFNFCKIIGQGLYSFVIISILGVIFMSLFIGIPNVDLLIFVPTFIITFFLGIILALFIYSIIGLLSFFIQDVRPIYWIVDKLVMILGGSYLPVALFPSILKIFAFISPFGAINFTSSTVYSSWNSEFIVRILLQVGWIVIFGLILYYVYEKVREKTMINGG